MSFPIRHSAQESRRDLLGRFTLGATRGASLMTFGLADKRLSQRVGLFPESVIREMTRHANAVPG